MTEPRRAVRLASRDSGDDVLDALHTEALAADPAGRIPAALSIARRIGQTAPNPGDGSTALLWETLATVAAADLTVARTLEPHLDALAILAQATAPVDLDAIGAGAESTWGVFAAEGGAPLRATGTGDRWSLDGTKPWCSLGTSLSHALVSAHLDGGGRRLFAVDLGHPGVRAAAGVWAARGLREVPSGPLDFAGVPAVPVGDAGWYLERPGFAWGGIGVAAVWWGGAVGVARRLAAASTSGSREPDQIAQMHIGAVDMQLEIARLALSAAAEAVDRRGADRSEMGIIATRTRRIVAHAAEEVITRTGHALGPAPLALEEEHAGRVADLQLYLRQDHAERDEAGLGRALVAAGGPSW